jgi:hypothetical protein
MGSVSDVRAEGQIALQLEHRCSTPRDVRLCHLVLGRRSAGREIRSSNGAAGRAALAFAISLVAGCSGSSSADVGNPAGYTVHVLTGDSLSAADVAINGLSIDVATVDTIDRSVQGIVDGNHAPRTVEEVTGQPPDLAVDFTGVATPVPPTFHGADLQWRSKFFLQNPRWKALVSHMGLGLLRFPGGQERVRYDGNQSASGTPETDTLVVAPDQPYEFRISGEDIASYIALCQDLGIAAEPEVNITVDDPAMWADMVSQVVDDLHYDLKYLAIGNEPDIDSVNGNWPYLGADGTTVDERRANALAHYTARYLSYRTAIEAVKPGLIHAFGELGGWSPGGLDANLDAILGGLGDRQPGAVAGHWYMLGHWGALQPPSDPQYPAIGHLVVTGNGINNIGYLAQIASTMRDRASAHGLANPKIFIGEFGTSWSATPADAEMSDRLAAALFNAEAQETGKAAGIDTMEWFGLSDPASFAPWVPSLIEVDDATDTPRPRPQYYVYLMYKYLYGNETVAVPDGRQPDWSIYAARGGGKSFLLLINRTAATEVTRVVKATTTDGDRLLRLTLHPHSLAIVSF